MALAVIWISVAVGVALGLWQRVAARTTGPIRTFAVVAAGLLVAMSLLPHAIMSEGLAGLGAALVSVALVPALERLVRIPFRKVSAEGLRLELGYAGLLLHRLGDGVVMGVEGHGSELSWAVGAHEIPIVALVTLAYARRGLRQALIRAALLGLSSSFGLWMVRSMPGAWHDLHGWVDAVAAGILVHILASEALPEDLETPRQRTYDVLGAMFGLLIVLVPSMDEHGDGPRVAGRLLDGALDAAPWLLLGLLGSAWWLARSPLREETLVLQPAAARPWPGVEAFVLGAGLLGGLGALAMVLAGASLSVTANTLLSRLVPRARAALPPELAEPVPPTTLAAALDGLVLRVGGWIALGLLAASYISTFVPGAQAFAAPEAGSKALLVAALALPSALCTAGAVPIAAALVAQGLPVTLAVAGVAGGPARLGWSCLAALGVCWVALALWVSSAPNLALPPGWLAASRLELGAVPRWISAFCIGLLVARSIWRVGVRGWLGASLRALGLRTRSDHAHAH
jgi:uncharacterized membrane protein YraQ (UPF0718 family)